MHSFDTQVKPRRSIKRTLRFSVIVSAALLVAFASVPFLKPATTYAASCKDEDFYGSNTIQFYDPCASTAACTAGTGTLDGPAPTQLTGESNAEKTWNYFIARGLTPIAAAGAMGNLDQESGFDPWIGESGSKSIDKGKMGVGFGLIQWTNTGGNSQGRRYQVMKYLEDNGVPLDATDPSLNDKALLYELNFLWDVEYGKMTWQEQINKETTIEGNTSVRGSDIEGNTGNGSTLYFHAAVERSADSPSMLQERIDSAKQFLDKFSGTSGGGGDCSFGGGLNLEQAKALFAQYMSIDNGDPNNEKQWFNGASTCKTGTDNCVAFVSWFINKYTTLKWASENGGLVLNALTAANPELENGTIPRPLSVFSTRQGVTICDDGLPCGHTGIVLGVDEAKGTVIVGEAAWCDPGFAGVHEYSIESWSDGTHKYGYLQGKMKPDAGL